MGITLILALSVALGADAFSLSLAIGLAGAVNRRMTGYISLVVALFHVIMPLIGLFLGEALGHLLGNIAQWLGGIVLVFLGGTMLWRVLKPKPEYYSFREGRERLFEKRLPQGISLSGIGPFALAASVSMDALSVGFSLGTQDSNIPLTIAIMGCTAGLMTGTGLLLGKKIKGGLDDKAELFGGLVLLLIGIKLLL